MLASVRNLLEGLGVAAKHAVEVFIVVFFGFLPLFALVLRKYISISGESKGNVDSGILDLAFSGGQLYLYVFSLFGTLMWVGVFDWSFVYGKLRLFFIFLLICIGFFLFALANFDPTFENFGKSDGWVVTGSYILFAISVFLYWAILVFREAAPPDVRDTLAAGARNMATELKKLTGARAE